MYSIHLNNCRFYAFHGMHEEETTVGAPFDVSLSAFFEAEELIAHLKDTINYVDVFACVRSHFGRAVPLLETLAAQIVNDVYLLDKRIKKIDIHITKLNPPIEGFNGTIGVSYSKSF
ncbi:MAG TPA: dihydroneopterin aldolase [Ferruginibacter sp.]|nr:dihydroneopterin aldolase [Ferruginibacter sp.]HRE63996.1 dihydroneopterin aldolase [Ferruginibacter sp.]